VRTRSNRSVSVGVIACVVASAGIVAGCELDNAGVPQVIPGPLVPSPVPLHAPYVWDTRDELMVWTGNTVSLGSFSMDSVDSNAAIAARFAGLYPRMVLRGPDIDPPARSIRAVRVRYQWFPDGVSTPEMRLVLKTGPEWKEAESAPLNQPAPPPLDVRYLYFHATPNPGLLKIDTITLVN
jgi:hypothetical protein